MKKFLHIIFFLGFSIKFAVSAHNDEIYIENNSTEQQIEINKFSKLRKIFNNVEAKDIYDVFIEYGNHATDVEQRQQSFSFIWREYEKLMLDMSFLAQLGLKLIRNFDHTDIRDLIASCVIENPNSYSSEDISLLFDLSKDEQSDKYKYLIAKSILEFFIENNYKNYYHRNNNLMIIVNQSIDMLFNLVQNGNDLESQFSALKLLFDTVKNLGPVMQKNLFQGLQLASRHLIKKTIFFFNELSQQSCMEQSKKIFKVEYVNIGIAFLLLKCDELYAQISPQLLLFLCNNVKNEYIKYYLSNNLLYYMMFVEDDKNINNDYIKKNKFYFQSAVNILFDLVKNAKNLDCKYNAFKRLQELKDQVKKDIKFSYALVQKIYEIAPDLKDEIFSQFSVDDSLIQEFFVSIDEVIDLAKSNWLTSYEAFIH